MVPYRMVLVLLHLQFFSYAFLTFFFTPSHVDKPIYGRDHPKNPAKVVSRRVVFGEGSPDTDM